MRKTEGVEMGGALTVEVWTEYKRTGAHALRDKIFLQYYPSVVRIASKFRAVYERNKDLAFDDLVQIGSLGLLKAIDRFDHTRNDSFLGFSGVYVNGAIVDAIRQVAVIPRRLNDYVRDFTIPDRFTYEELSKRLGVDIDTVKQIVFYERLVRVGDMPTGVSGEQHTRHLEPPATDWCEPAFVFEELIEVSESVGSLIYTLPGHLAVVVRLVYFDGLLQNEIADRLKISVDQIQFRLEKAMHLLYLEAKRRGLHVYIDRNRRNDCRP